jgi:hypothetical protein
MSKEIIVDDSFSKLVALFEKLLADKKQPK